MPRRVYPNLAAFFRDQERGTAMKVADELGISYPYLSMIKWGTREPDLDLALRIQARCQVPLESLIRRHRKAS